jgi:hypothetical protein
VTARRRVAGAAVGAIVALGAAALGCGGDSDKAESPPPPARPEDFPRPKGRSLAELRHEIGRDGPILAPSVSEFEPGSNRFGFGLFDPARTQIADAPTALYVARVGGGPAHGPALARYESLEVEPQYQSRTVESDPMSAQTLYVADLELPKPGRYEVLAVTRLVDRLVTAGNAGGPVEVKRRSPVPDVGDRAPRTDTPTRTDVNGDLAKIDTRQPPSSMHEVSFADVVGKRPAVLVFATPQLCRSKVCGPVVDIAEQVKANYGDKVAFVHQEIFRDNEIDKGYRPQVVEWRLPTEPWVFVVDRRGRIAARMEGAYSARELDRAVRAAIRGASTG